MLLEPRTPWPARVVASPQRPAALDGAAAVVTFIGHSTFLIQTASGNILTDPMYSRRAGPLSAIGPRRVRQPAVMFDDLPAHLDLEASESVGMHFGTFQLTTEGIDEPLRALEDACRTRNVPRSRFRTIRFGNRCG